MSEHCCHTPAPAKDSCATDHCGGASCAPQAAAKILWVALVINFSMFVVEMIAGLQADSAALLADALDFFGDSFNYALSLAALGLLPVWRSRAALVKGFTMLGYGVFVLAQAGWILFSGAQPEAMTMGAVGFLALLANLSVLFLLYRFRDGDANMRSVWLCSRNDVIGNTLVMLAALGVWGTATAFPDIAVAVIMAGLNLSSARVIIRQARSELNAR